MRRTHLDTTPHSTERLLGAIVVLADVALWTVVVPSQTLVNLLPA